MENTNRYLRAVQFAREAYNTCDQAEDPETCKLYSTSRLCQLASTTNKYELRSIIKKANYYPDLMKICDEALDVTLSTTKLNPYEKVSNAMFRVSTMQECKDKDIIYCKDDKKVYYGYWNKLVLFLQNSYETCKNNKTEHDIKECKKLNRYMLCSSENYYKKDVPLDKQDKTYISNIKKYCKEFAENIGDKCELINNDKIKSNQEECKKYKNNIIEHGII